MADGETPNLSSAECEFFKEQGYDWIFEQVRGREGDRTAAAGEREGDRTAAAGERERDRTAAAAAAGVLGVGVGTLSGRESL